MVACRTVVWQGAKTTVRSFARTEMGLSDFTHCGRLGGAPLEHRSDIRSAAFRNLNLEAPADLTTRSAVTSATVRIPKCFAHRAYTNVPGHPRLRRRGF